MSVTQTQFEAAAEVSFQNDFTIMIKQDYFAN